MDGKVDVWSAEGKGTEIKITFTAELAGEELVGDCETDLLKNYLFSESGDQGIAHAESVWTRVSGQFDKADDLVKFLRYEYMSRKGRVTNRSLYLGLQDDIGNGATAVLPYVARARANAPVATPVTWTELRSIDSAHAFTIQARDFPPFP